MSGQEIILRGEKQREFAVGFIQKLRIDPERPFVLSIEPYRKKRTLSQLALLWVRHAEVSQAVADYTGYSAEDIHDIVKRKFLKPRIVEIGDTVVERYSTKGLTVTEMADFMTKIEAWASSELGLILATPEDRMYGDAA